MVAQQPEPSAPQPEKIIAEARRQPIFTPDVSLEILRAAEFAIPADTDANALIMVQLKSAKQIPLLELGRHEEAVEIAWDNLNLASFPGTHTDDVLAELRYEYARALFTGIRLVEGKEHLNEALRLASPEQRILKAQCHLKLASYYAFDDQKDEMHDQIDEALDSLLSHHETLEEFATLAQVYIARASAARMQGQTELSKEARREASELLNGLDEMREIVICTQLEYDIEIAKLALSIDDYENAERRFEMAMATLEAATNKRPSNYRVTILLNQGVLALMNDDYEAAEQAFFAAKRDLTHLNLADRHPLMIQITVALESIYESTERSAEVAGLLLERAAIEDKIQELNT